MKINGTEKRHAITTIKVSRRVIVHIIENGQRGESVDETLRRLLRVGGNGQKKPKEIPDYSIVKISRALMNRIMRNAREGEMRDETLCRLLGIPLDAATSKN